MEKLTLLQVTIGGLAAGLLAGVLLPLRWSVVFAAVVSIAYTAYFVAQTPSRHDSFGVAVFFLLVVAPQIIAPIWFGVAGGFAIRSWTKDRLLLRFAGTLAGVALIAGAYVLLDADPKWKQSAERKGAAFVRGHVEVMAKLGPIKRATPISMRLGGPLPYSQIDYYVDGAKRNAVVVVEVSGERKAPTFRVVAIKDDR